jgi:hypothetical protein
LAIIVPQVEHDVIESEFSPQLINRFFDVLTIQKTMSKILFDGPGAALQVFIALVLMSFYSPYLLAFAVWLMLFIVFVILGARESADCGPVFRSHTASTRSPTGWRSWHAATSASR